MASFSVAALMKETADVVMRFAAHYHRLGAERVFVYIDGPAEPDMEAGLDRIRLAELNAELIFCDASFWDGVPMARPDDVQPRQSAIYEMAKARCESEWLFLCDADEFLIDRIAICDFLDRIPAGIPSVRISPAEAVWGPGEDLDRPFGSTWFRRPRLKNKWIAACAYGPWSVFLRDGLIGHTIGKQFIRRDVRFDVIDLHFSFAGGQRVTRLAEGIDPALAVVELAHYDAISFPRWRLKFERRLRNEHPSAMRRRSGRRQLQHRLFAACERMGPRAVRGLFARMYRLNARQARFLAARDLAFQMDVFEMPQSAESIPDRGPEHAEHSPRPSRGRGREPRMGERAPGGLVAGPGPGERR